MKLSLLVPCFNEEKSIEACIQSCLLQIRKFDEIVFVDDCSTDGTPDILAAHATLGHIITKRTESNTGNKSTAQEFGLRFVTGDVVVTTDADTFYRRDRKEFPKGRSRGCCRSCKKFGL